MLLITTTTYLITHIPTDLEGALVRGEVVVEARLGVLHRVEQHQCVQGAHELHHQALGRDQRRVCLLLLPRTHLPGGEGSGWAASYLPSTWYLRSVA